MNNTKEMIVLNTYRVLFNYLETCLGYSKVSFHLKRFPGCHDSNVNIVIVSTLFKIRCTHVINIYQHSQRVHILDKFQRHFDHFFEIFQFHFFLSAISFFCISAIKSLFSANVCVLTIKHNIIREIDNVCSIREGNF